MNRSRQSRTIATGALSGLVALCAALVAGCGFTPLYGVPGVVGGLSAITVNAPHGRTAFLLAQDLEDDLARDRGAPPLYRLDLKVQQHEYARGLQLSGVASRYEMHVTVTYQLIELASGKTLKTGVEPVEVSYASSDAPYAGVAAQQDAESRAASTASDHIKTRLAVYFAGRADH